MKTVRHSILKKINTPHPASHKGENGRMLVIAGSEKFHGALLFAVKTASHIIDIVYIYSTPENFSLVKKLKEGVAAFISVQPDELDETAQMVDSILIGPGLDETKENVVLTKKLLKKYPQKATVIDATALWHLNPEWLHEKCILTPHSREFENVFKCKANAESTQAMAKKYNCIIVLKGPEDYISNGEGLWVNKTGNAGMTKGGTGDVLSAMIAAFATTNDVLTATLAGTYLNGYAGDRLQEKVGTFYNAEDLIEELGRVWKKELS